MKKNKKLSPALRDNLKLPVVIGSAMLCLMLLPTRFPGMEILGVGPSWLVMWILAWSLHRSLWHAAGAGIVLGLIQDAMTFPHTTPLGIAPTHVISLGVVGVLAWWAYKYRYLEDSLPSVSAGAFLLAIVNEVVTGLQYFLQIATQESIAVAFDRIGLWATQLPMVLIAAVLSGLWMPILYYPLQLWWSKTLSTAKSA